MSTLAALPMITSRIPPTGAAARAPGAVGPGGRDAAPKEPKKMPAPDAAERAAVQRDAAEEPPGGAWATAKAAVPAAAAGPAQVRVPGQAKERETGRRPGRWTAAASDVGARATRTRARPSPAHLEPGGIGVGPGPAQAGAGGHRQQARHVGWKHGDGHTRP